ncbi:LacI family DNA-binding transcriptional regulator [Sessilibacter sp. MAH1]
MSSKTKSPQLTQMTDIARLAGVSVSTVSRALSGSELVNEKTRDLVNRIAQEHNYRVNTRARNFRKKDCLTFAFLLPAAHRGDWSLSDPFFMEIMSSVAEAVDSRGHQLLLASTRAISGDWLKDFVQSHTTDGVILIGQGGQHVHINDIAKSFPFISVWGAKISDDQSYSTVGTDNEEGGFRATSHLLNIGRRRIAFLGYSNQPEIKLRDQGYRRALREFGLDVSPGLERIALAGKDVGYQTTRELIRSGVEFDAIFAVSDVYAIAALQALQEEGLRVPEDVAIVGYDDIAMASLYNPSLTTIRQNHIDAGPLLVDNVLSAMAGEKPKHIEMVPELVVRASSVPSAKK